MIGDRLQESHDKHLEEQSRQKKAEFDTLWASVRNSAPRIEELNSKKNKSPEEEKELKRLTQQWQWSYDALTKATKSNKQASGAIQKFGQVFGKVLGHTKAKQSFDQGPQQPPDQGGQPPVAQQPSLTNSRALKAQLASLRG